MKLERGWGASKQMRVNSAVWVRPMQDWLATTLELASVWALINDSSILTNVSSPLAPTHTARRPYLAPTENTAHLDMLSKPTCQFAQTNIT